VVTGFLVTCLWTLNFATGAKDATKLSRPHLQVEFYLSQSVANFFSLEGGVSQHSSCKFCYR